MADHSCEVPALAKDRIERDEEDLVRLYLTDIGQYTLLTKDDEVRLAKQIEAGKAAGEELDKAGLDIDSETRSYLMARLGADQAMSRAEVAKLALFAADHGRVSAEDVDAIVGDSAEIAVENFVYDVSAGETKEALRELARLAASGTEPSVVLSALGRHFTQLHRIASAQAAGVAPEHALRSLRPRPHFKREKALVADSRRLGADRLFAALPLIQEAVKRARLNPDLGGYNDYDQLMRLDEWQARGEDAE